MKRYSTLLLRCAVVAAGLIMLAMDVGVAFWASSIVARNPGHTTIFIVLLTGLYLASVPFFIALFQAMKLLGCIDANRAFSDISVHALKIITRCAGAIFILFSLAGLPFFYYWAQVGDAPGVMLMGLIISGVALSVTIFASLLKRLWQVALDAITENDLTI